jgi:hypothetical protein
MVTALNYYGTVSIRKAKKEEKERQERIAREIKLAEEARLERERNEAKAILLRQKETERLIRAETMRQKLLQREEDARAQLEALPKLKKRKPIELKVLTHHSKCHSSRETLDTNIGTIII